MSAPKLTDTEREVIARCLAICAEDKRRPEWAVLPGESLAELRELARKLGIERDFLEARLRMQAEDTGLDVPTHGLIQ